MKHANQSLDFTFCTIAPLHHCTIVGRKQGDLSGTAESGR